MGTMDMDEFRSHVFKADKVYYDLGARNQKIFEE
jgi:hypothetical protein